MDTKCTYMYSYQVHTGMHMKAWHTSCVHIYMYRTYEALAEFTCNLRATDIGMCARDIACVRHVCDRYVCERHSVCATQLACVAMGTKWKVLTDRYEI